MPTDTIREAMATVRGLIEAESNNDLLGELTFSPTWNRNCATIARWLVQHAGELVRVKGLEWKDRKDASFASTNLFGQFCARPEAWTVPGQPWTKSTSREDAKAKAEQWYRDRLAAALDPLFGEGGK